jgi:hypothetical protein
VQPIGRVCAQRGFLDVSPWYESAFLSCKIEVSVRRGKMGRMKKGKTDGVSAFRFRLSAFRRVVPVPEEPPFVKPAGTTFAKGLPSLTRYEQPDKRKWPEPARYGDRQK